MFDRIFHRQSAGSQGDASSHDAPTSDTTPDGSSSSNSSQVGASSPSTSDPGTDNTVGPITSQTEVHSTDDPDISRVSVTTELVPNRERTYDEGGHVKSERGTAITVTTEATAPLDKVEDVAGQLARAGFNAIQEAVPQLTSGERRMLSAADGHHDAEAKAKTSSAAEPSSESALDDK